MSDSFIWYELLTSDAEAAASFYSAVVGWVAEDSGQQAVRYTLLKAGPAPVAGLMALTPEMISHQVGPTWLGYVHVDDVDTAVTAVVAAGGRLRQAPPDIPEVGRFAVVADPQGAAVGLFAPVGAADAPQPPPMSPGSVGWHELHTSGWQSAFDFYAARFGWDKSQAMDMGPMGTYQLISRDGRDIGAMFDDASLGGPAWLFYFVVGDIDEAAQRVLSGGGEVLNGPMEVPGGAWVINCRDPQGAMFALVGNRG